MAYMFLCRKEDCQYYCYQHFFLSSSLVKTSCFCTSSVQHSLFYVVFLRYVVFFCCYCCWCFFLTVLDKYTILLPRTKKMHYIIMYYDDNNCELCTHSFTLLLNWQQCSRANKYNTLLQQSTQFFLFLFSVFARYLYLMEHSICIHTGIKTEKNCNRELATEPRTIFARGNKRAIKLQ